MRFIDRQRWPILITFADSWQGHKGTIYKAAGWLQCGETKPEATYTLADRMICRKAGPKTRTHSENRASAEMVNFSPSNGAIMDIISAGSMMNSGVYSGSRVAFFLNNRGGIFGKEHMKSEPNSELDKYRVSDQFGSTPLGASYGMFRIVMRSCVLRVISSGTTQGNPQADGWEHVSISIGSRCPTWEEMCFVKNLFWGDDESVIQFHPMKSNYVNKHPYCLHLWRHQDGHKLPPQEFV